MITGLFISRGSDLIGLGHGAVIKMLYSFLDDFNGQPELRITLGQVPILNYFFKTNSLFFISNIL